MSYFVLYLCPSLKNRNELINIFSFEISCARISRWRDFPAPGNPSQILIGISDDYDDQRAKKLRENNVQVFSSQWFIQCCASKRILPFPNLVVGSPQKKLLQSPLPRQSIPYITIVYTPNSLGWTQAQDDVIRAFHELRILNQMEKAMRCENFLVGRNYSREQVRCRERDLFGFCALEE